MKRFLVLEDGTKFEGEAFGSLEETTGEVVFSTAMVGYPESLTDPSYQGQILVLTYPIIGNYGVPSREKKNGFAKRFESNSIKIRGLVVSEYVDKYSHWQAASSLDKWLKEEDIPAVSGIDTRNLTIKLREKGVMLGVLQSRISASKPNFSDPNSENLVSQVSVKKPQILGKGKKKILLIDCGVKQGIINNLLQRNTSIIQVPWDYDPFNSSSFGGFDGVVVSNGPGDPKMAVQTIKTLQKILNKKIPTLGICLGNQILALAAGGNTYKLKYGHRSHNQPVRLTNSKKCFLTTQNHGFVVDTKSLSRDWEIWFENLNDGTNEGVRHKSLPFLSVQFHPEGRPGPEDTNWVFDEFIKTLEH